MSGDSSRNTQQSRRERLARELRANLKRRKAKGRSVKENGKEAGKDTERPTGR